MTLRRLARSAACGTVLALAAGASLAVAPAAAAPVHRIAGIVPHHAAGAPGTAAHAGVRFINALQPIMVRHGGPVQHTNAVRAIFWRPSGFSFPAGYEAILTRFFTDVAAASGRTDNVYAVTPQYYDDAGAAGYSSQFLGAIDATDAIPGGAGACTDPEGSGYECVTDTQMQQVITAVLAARGITPGPNDITYLFTPEFMVSCADDAGTECSTNVYCGYHSVHATGHYAYAHIPFEDPFDIGGGCDTGEYPNANLAADVATSITSHEQIETITDPDAGGGWFDDQNGGAGEIGDKCAYTFGDPIGSNGFFEDYNQVINGHTYWVQEEWSNNPSPGLGLSNVAADDCVQTYSQGLAAMFNPTTAELAAGSSVTFDASRSVNPGAVITSFQWSFGDGTSATTTTPSVAHTYANASPAAGYTVQLFATSSTGATSITGQDYAVLSAARASIVASSASLPTGQPFSFNGAGSSGPGGKPVASYTWSFGDGTTASGPSTGHAYAKAGIYQVALTVVDAAGVGATSQQAVTVTDRAPVAAFAASAASGLVGQAITFDGHTSSDPDGTVAGFAWAFGDGKTGTGASSSHAFAKAGTFTVTLTVTDDNGVAATTQRTLTIKPFVIGQALVLHQKLKDVLAHGLRVAVSCPVACAIREDLLIPASLARRLHLGRKPLKIGTGSGTAPQAGKKTITVKLTTVGRRLLRNRHALAVTLRATVTVDGTRKVSSRSITLRH